MATIIYPVTAGSVSALTFSRRAALPIRYACAELSGGFVSDSTDRWNCNLCDGKLFYQPYTRGDIMPFQTQFADKFNMPNDILTAGIYGLISTTDFYVKIELLDGAGVVVTDIVDDFCEIYWVGYSVKTGPLQTWFVNTGLFPDDLDCWSLKVTYYKINQVTALPEIERIIHSEEYKETPECTSTTKIESVYSNFDCNGNFYQQLTNTLGLGNAAYYNSVRVFGRVETVGESSETTTNDRNVVISQDITKSFKIISSAVPVYFFERVSQAVRGNAITVGGVSGYEAFELTEKEDSFSMFLLDVSFLKRCRIENKTCNF
jgi:hypothetical protein